MVRQLVGVVAGLLLLLVGTADAQTHRGTYEPASRPVGNPTLEIMVGPHFGSGTLAEFDDPVIFEQELDYSGYFLKTILSIPWRRGTTLLIRGDVDFLESEGLFLFPLVNEFELERRRTLVSFGIGLRFQLR